MEASRIDGHRIVRGGPRRPGSAAIARLAVLGGAGLALVLGSARTAGASGFFLLESSVRAQGMSYAGTGALAVDATANFYNPAGLTLLPKEWNISQSMYYISIESELEASKATTFGQPVTGPNGSMRTSPGVDDFIPSIQMSKRLTDTVVLGFGVNGPFGLRTQYPNDSVARYIATKSKLVTYNFNPNIAWQANPAFSLAAGFSAVYGQASLDQQLLNPLTREDINVRIYGDDWTFGWNLAALFHPVDWARVGIAYRSPLTFTFQGPATLSPNALFDSVQRAKATGNLPDVYTLSGLIAATPHLRFVGDLAFIRWSTFHSLQVKFSRAEEGSTAQILPNVVVPTDFRDAWRGSVGVEYDATDWLMVRAGYAYDQSPVTDGTRTARIPDTNRQYLSFGLSVPVSTVMSVDLGYTHIFAQNGSINQTATSIDASQLVGEYTGGAVDLAGFQMNFAFDTPQLTGALGL